MVLAASAGGIAGATSAIFPAAIATSRTASMPLRASMTWPPLRSRSYLAAGAGVWAWNRTAPATIAASTPVANSARFTMLRPAVVPAPGASP
jgi:hypothetical protein